MPKREWMLVSVLLAGCGLPAGTAGLSPLVQPGGPLSAASLPHVPANPLAPLPAIRLDGGSDVPNLGWVSQGTFLRSGQPTGAGWQELKTRYDLGADVNLRKEDDSEAPIVEQLGIDYLYLPIQDGGIPTPDQVRQFFTFVYAERAQGKVIDFHCRVGEGRTGTFDVLLREASGWTVENAILDSTRFRPIAPDQAGMVNAFAQAIGLDTWYPYPVVGHSCPYTYSGAQSYVWGPSPGTPAPSNP